VIGSLLLPGPGPTRAVIEVIGCPPPSMGLAELMQKGVRSQAPRERPSRSSLFGQVGRGNREGYFDSISCHISSLIHLIIKPISFVTFL
jgi:hypothetical protein